MVYNYKKKYRHMPIRMLLYKYSVWRKSNLSVKICSIEQKREVTERSIMNEEKAIEARNKAGSYYREGYNCAESIFLTYREYLAPELDPSLVKLMTGFGAGMGHHGCMCGALAGSVVALNMLKGRSTSRESRDGAYDLAKEFAEKFEEKNNATCCRVLNPHPFGTIEQKTNCLKIIGNTSKLLMEFLEEKELVK